MDDLSLAHSRYNCTYHILFIPKYRRKAMFGALRREVGEILGKVCKMEEVTVVVCVKDWADYVRELVKEYSLTKVKWIIEGGKTGHDSIRNGVFFLRDKIEPEDFVVIHDAVRPILPQKAINEVLCVAHENGNIFEDMSCRLIPIELT